jgi:hypothetical protein
MIDSRSDGLLDHDLARMRAEWVAAYLARKQVAGDKALTSTGLTDQRRQRGDRDQRPRRARRPS